MISYRCWTTLGLVGLLLIPEVVKCSDQETDSYNQGASYLQNGDLDASILAFTEAIRLNPKSAEAIDARRFETDLPIDPTYIGQIFF
jgi:hypothetical protein